MSWFYMKRWTTLLWALTGRKMTSALAWINIYLISVSHYPNKINKSSVARSEFRIIFHLVTCKSSTKYHKLVASASPCWDTLFKTFTVRTLASPDRHLHKIEFRQLEWILVYFVHNKFQDQYFPSFCLDSVLLLLVQTIISPFFSRILLYYTQYGLILNSLNSFTCQLSISD